MFVEVDLVLRARGHAGAAVAFGRALLDSVHRLEAPTEGELALALDLADRYADFGVDLPDTTVMAMAANRGGSVLTWDFRHFRSVALHKAHTWSLLVEETELPTP